ncbi:MAG: hypothetical protein FJW30_27560 [Acidobacteria bacterium]|nr:hypothetical protein [Acidobacteriota bacterium]
MARALAAFLLLSGCGGYYRYERLANTDLVTPPNSKLPRTKCVIETETIALRGNRIRYKAPEQDDPSRIPMYVLNDFRTLRRELDRCLPPAKAAAAVHQVALKVPMASGLAAQLVYGGNLELRPPLSLHYVTPNEPGTGVLTARYAVEPNGRIRRVEGPETALDGFVSKHQAFQLLYLTRGADANHGEILLGAASREALRHTTAACESVEYSCFPLEKGTVLRPEFAITVDGVRKYVPHFSTVRDATDRKIVFITRGASKRPIRTQASLNGLALLGGEIIKTAP